MVKLFMCHVSILSVPIVRITHEHELKFIVLKYIYRKCFIQSHAGNTRYALALRHINYTNRTSLRAVDVSDWRARAPRSASAQVDRAEQ